MVNKTEKYNWKVIEDDGEGKITETLFDNMMTAYSYFESTPTSLGPKASTTIHIVEK